MSSLLITSVETSFVVGLEEQSSPCQQECNTETALNEMNTLVAWA